MFGAVAGLCITKEDELYQIYVAQTARGTGLAQSLMDDAEAGLLSKGVQRARLVCAIGNERAAHFYRKCGWTMVRRQIESFETPDGRSRWRFGALKNCYRRQVKPTTVDYFPKGPNVAATDAGLIS